MTAQDSCCGYWHCRYCTVSPEGESDGFHLGWRHPCGALKAIRHGLSNQARKVPGKQTSELQTLDGSLMIMGGRLELNPLQASMSKEQAALEACRLSY